MQTHPRPVVTRPIVGAVLLALGLLLVWVEAPEALLVPILLVGLAAEAIFYGVLYVMQRRRHW
jgi:hypothetical protein